MIIKRPDEPLNLQRLQKTSPQGANPNPLAEPIPPAAERKTHPRPPPGKKGEEGEKRKRRAQGEMRSNKAPLLETNEGLVREVLEIQSSLTAERQVSK